MKCRESSRTRGEPLTRRTSRDMPGTIVASTLSAFSAVVCSAFLANHPCLARVHPSLEWPKRHAFTAGSQTNALPSRDDL